MKTPLHRFLVLAGFATLAQSADLTSMGDWTESITATDLVSGAGTDLKPQFESAAGVTTLTVSNAPGPWTVSVKRTGNGGHGDVTVYVKRVSGGSGIGTIDGGTAYQTLTGADVDLFSGTEDRNGISLQFKLTGITRDVPPANYLSTIVFTVR
jgi:hypothetical protein